MKRAAWVLAAGMLAAGLGVQAATYTYDAGGANRSLWSDRVNWGNDVPPSFNNQADLVFDTNIGVNNLRIGADRVVRSLAFGPDLHGLDGATFDVQTIHDSGGAATLYFNGGSGNAAITVAAGHGNRQIRLGGALGFMSLQTDLDLHVHHAAAPLLFDGRVFGIGRTINKHGIGKASATRENGFGGIVVHAGIFQVYSHPDSGGTGSGGVGALAVGGAGGATDAVLEVGTTVARTNPITVNPGAGARTIRNMDAGVAAGAGNPTLEGAITLGKDVEFSVTQYASGTHDRIIVSGAIGGEGGVAKTGSGILQLSGANTYSGGTTVRDGVLIVKTGESLPGQGSLALGSSAGLALDFSGMQTVRSLSLDGGKTWLAPGTYTAAKLAAAGRGTYRGTGTVRVLHAEKTPRPWGK